MLQRFFENLLYQGLEAIGRYYSMYRGHVVDNEDPDGLNRLSIIVPSVSGNKTHPTWAYPRNSFSGNDYGMQVLPQKGDLVMIEFEHGDPKFPIWSHAHFTQEEKPEEFVSPQVYGFKSPKGQIIVIDDRDDVEKIIINHGENAGLVKVIELTEMLNKIEDKLNDHLSHYRTHIHIDPLSGYTGQPTPVAGEPDFVTPIPLDVNKTDQDYIENENVQH